MCGIAGIISTKEKSEELDAMLNIQSHRGPDFTGKFEDKGFAYIGHNRLSIIDLTQAANQPFIDPSGRYILSFNGEIYNYLELKEELSKSYSFITSSDTEVLLASFIKFGTACLEKFIGMFSFAIWDSKEKKLFAARDRFGVKPFYYSNKEDDLYFSSEIKALLAAGIESKFDERVWANYFAYGTYGTPEETFYENIFQLPAGHFLFFKDGNITIKKWYNFVERIKQIPVISNFEDAKKKYLVLLKNSIQLRFRADVNIGFNISGGVDSSLLLALVNKDCQSEKVTAFTFYTGNEKYDELPWVEKVIATTGNPLIKIKLDAQEVRKLAPNITYFEDEPFGGIPTLAYSKIFEQAKKENIRVLLDGQGIDEQWAGYDYYTLDNFSTIQGQANLSPIFKHDCLSWEMQKITSKPVYPEPFDNALQNKQYRDLFFTKIPRVLRFNDRISMAHSTELREPFLDHRLVEFAFAQPENFKIKGNVHKHLVREIIKDLVPQTISYAPKRPLQTPQREWLAEDLKEWVEEILERLFNSEYKTWFNINEIKREWNEYKEGKIDSSFHIWQWISLFLLLNSRNNCG